MQPEGLVVAGTDQAHQGGQALVGHGVADYPHLQRPLERRGRAPAAARLQLLQPGGEHLQHLYALGHLRIHPRHDCGAAGCAGQQHIGGGHAAAAQGQPAAALLAAQATGLQAQPALQPVIISLVDGAEPVVWAEQGVAVAGQVEVVQGHHHPAAQGLGKQGQA